MCRRDQGDSAKELAEKHGIDFAQSYAYGNSELDIPLLREVEHPVIVQASPKLLRYAQHHNWSQLPETS